MNAVADPRFAKFQTDPRFRLPSSKHAKIALDDRFSRMLDDEDFTKKAKVDNYGRKVSSKAGEKHLRRLYKIETEKARVGDNGESPDEDEEVQAELAKATREYDPARDGGFSHSSSSEDESEDETDSAEEEELDLVDSDPVSAKPSSEVPLGEVTRRIGIVNLDWDNIQATDLMAVFRSFLPPTGRIEEIVIYPSEFGRERMEREEIEGPPKEIFNGPVLADTEDADESEHDQDEDQSITAETIVKEDKGEEFSNSDLRKYQLDRLRYYYAVVTFNSPATAEAIYGACDGAEYQSSANFFDLRFIPDDVTFDMDKPRDRCSALPDTYQPNEFVTDVLQHSKVKLSWDAEDNIRKDAIKRAFAKDEVEEEDLRAYLASSSESEEESSPADTKVLASNPGPSLSKKEQHRQRVRQMLGLDPEDSKKVSKSGPVGDMQITFSSGLNTADGDSKRNGVFLNEPELTTVEKYVQKERERKTKRKDRYKQEKAVNKTEIETMLAGRQAKSAARKSDQTTEGHGDAEVSVASADEFQDEFFNEKAVTKTNDSQRKKRRKHRHGSEELDPDAAKKKAELELLLMDDRDGAGAMGGPEKDFAMDTADPRFTAVFDSHEYAIDPSHPRFNKKADGMRKLLEEGRRRRKRKGMS